jgi:hypothetical protein
MLRAMLAGVAALCCALPAEAVRLIPADVAPKPHERCWVRFFGAEDFKQPLGRLPGGLYIQSIAGPGLVDDMELQDFFERTESLVMGPEARLVGYAERGFVGEVLALEPRRKVANLRALGFPERLASMKIICE